MHSRKHLQYVAAVSGEIHNSKRWTVELASMLSRKFGIQKASAYKILRRIYLANSDKIERHRIGKNDMKIHANTLVWRGREDLLKSYLGEQMTVREFK